MLLADSATSLLLVVAAAATAKMYTPTGSPGAQTSGSNLQRTTPRGNSGDTPSAKRNKPRTPEQRAAPHHGDVPENVLDELCDGAIRELDHFELGLPAGDEQIAKLLDDKRAELRRLIRTYPDVRRIVETAARVGKERVILVKPRVPVSGHDGSTPSESRESSENEWARGGDFFRARGRERDSRRSGIDVERVSFTPISAYVFYFVINSTSRLQLAIAESESKLEKHSMEVHLENRVALGLFGERDGEVTYASYAGMTPVSGSKARGDAHRRGDSGAPRLNAATTGACGKFFAMRQVQVAAPTTVEDAEWIAHPRVRSTARDRARPIPPAGGDFGQRALPRARPRIQRRALRRAALHPAQRRRSPGFPLYRHRARPRPLQLAPGAHPASLQRVLFCNFEAEEINQAIHLET